MAVSARDVQPLVDQIKRILSGQPAELQGAVLADCLAIWLAAHHVPGNEDATRSLRAEMLAMHRHVVRQLVPINARMIGTTP
jgi:hypothetical protein